MLYIDTDNYLLIYIWKRVMSPSGRSLKEMISTGQSLKTVKCEINAYYVNKPVMNGDSDAVMPH